MLWLALLEHSRFESLLNISTVKWTKTFKRLLRSENDSHNKNTWIDSHHTLASSLDFANFILI